MKLNLAIELSEEEVRALYEITRYDVESFLKVFYEKMGKAYLEKYQTGVRTFFNSFTREAGPWLTKADEAREVFNKESKNAS